MKLIMRLNGEEFDKELRFAAREAAFLNQGAIYEDTESSESMQR